MLVLNVEILKTTIKSLTGEINWCKCDLHYNESCGLMFGLINVTAPAGISILNLCCCYLENLFSFHNEDWYLCFS